MRPLAIGVDLGGTNMRVAAIEDDGTQLQIIRSATNLARGYELVMGELVSMIRDLVRTFAANRRLLGIGVGIPGIIDLESGTLKTASNIPGWNDCPLRDTLESALQAPVILDNDANCAALGEKWIGAGRNLNDLCMLTLGTGVGGGFILNGKPWHGAIGMAGELGHMSVVPEGRGCACGNRGCLEQYASATAIRRMALEAVAAGLSPQLAGVADLNPHFDARAVFDCAVAGDSRARAIFESVGTALGVALANLINALNLPVYVVGGGVSNAWEAFSPSMFRQLSKRSIVFRAGELQQSQKKTTIVTRTFLQENAGLLGAARLPMLAEQSTRRSPLAV
jgi:glucokinase